MYSVIQKESARIFVWQVLLLAAEPDATFVVTELPKYWLIDKKKKTYYLNSHKKQNKKKNKFKVCPDFWLGVHKLTNLLTKGLHGSPISKNLFIGRQILKYKTKGRLTETEFKK